MFESPAGTEPDVSRGPRSGRRRWNEGVEVTVQPLLAACVLVALARHVLGCPSRRPDRAGREPRAAIRPAPIERGVEVTAPAAPVAKSLESAGYPQRPVSACIHTSFCAYIPPRFTQAFCVTYCFGQVFECLSSSFISLNLYFFLSRQCVWVCVPTVPCSSHEGVPQELTPARLAPPEPTALLVVSVCV